MNDNRDTTSGATLNIPNKLVKLKFGDYTIVVKISAGNEFIGIHEISMDKSFYSYNNVPADNEVEKYYSY